VSSVVALLAHVSMLFAVWGNRLVLALKTRQGRERRPVCDKTMSTSSPANKALFMHNGLLFELSSGACMHPMLPFLTQSPVRARETSFC
jgi:hypothetical protein